MGAKLVFLWQVAAVRVVKVVKMWGFSSAKDVKSQKRLNKEETHN